MGNPVDAITNGVSDATGASASSKTSANQTVKAANGAIGLITDIPTFGGTTATGVWTLGTMRCRINGLPMISTAAAGVGISTVQPPPTSGPLRLGQSDSKVKAL